MIIHFGRKTVLAHVRHIMATREPDFIVGEKDAPYLRRWYITPKNLRWLCAIYAHEFRRDDDDVPHDHPYLFNISWLLDKGYLEHVFKSWFSKDYRTDLKKRFIRPGRLVFRWGRKAHRIELVNPTVYPISLFIMGPRVFTWGFYCPQGWKPYFDYVAPTSYGNRVGKGCGD